MNLAYAMKQQVRRRLAILEVKPSAILITKEFIRWLMRE